MTSEGPLSLTVTTFGTTWALCTSALAETASTGRFENVTVLTVAKGVTATSGVSRRLWMVIQSPAARIRENNFQVRSLVIQSRFGINSVAGLFEFRAGFIFGDDRRAGLVPFTQMGTEPINNAVRLRRLDEQGREKCAQFLQGDAAHQLAFVGMRNLAVFLRHRDYHCVGFLGQADGRAMASAERLVQILPLRQRENTGRVSDAVAFDDDPAVVNGIVGK